MVSASAVNALRKRTGLPMMDCKKALTEAGGDEEKAIEWLRKHGEKIQETRTGRTTEFGRFGLYHGTDKDSGAIVEVLCESAPVAGSEEFVQFASDCAEALAKADQVEDGDALLDLPSPRNASQKLRDVKDDMFNRIREVFNIGRFQKFEGTCGGYAHNKGTVSGVLIRIEGGDDEAAKNVAMHIAAMRPAVLSTEDLPPEELEKERSILREAALQEGKPENIVDKMVEGRLRNYCAERVLVEQAYVKDESLTVGKYAQQNNMKIKEFVHWELGAQ